MAKAVKTPRASGKKTGVIPLHRLRYGFKKSDGKTPGAQSKAARRARAKAGGPPKRRIVLNNPGLEAALQAAVLQESLDRMATAPI